MKKILISILIILLITLTCMIMIKGISIAGCDILSFNQIAEKNDELDRSIETATSTIKVDYESEKVALSNAIDDLLRQKEEYFDIAKKSTEGEITKATTKEVYSIEYLWTNIGRHATAKGINLKMDVKPGDTGEEDLKNLSFTADGSYVGIIQFITSLENDTELNFRIDDFKMIGADTLTATFNVKNIRVKKEEKSELTNNTTTADETTNNVTNQITNQTTNDTANAVGTNDTNNINSNIVQ